LACDRETARPSSTTTTTEARATSTRPSGTATPPATVEAFPLPTGAAWRRDFPDPFLLASGGRHLAVSTTSGSLQLQGLTSAVLSDWAGPVEVLDRVPPWATPWSAWAPALLQVGDELLLYYTAQVAGTDQHCIAVARATGQAERFVDVHAQPLVCPTSLGGAIDPSPFRDQDGRLYLLWKNDGVTLRRASAIWIQPLTPDGLALAGPATQLIGTDQTWEYPHVEAPSMVRVGDDYWLAYSGNWWNDAAYGIGMARCDSPVGPCEKPYDGPVVASAPGRQGPGGAEFFTDRAGRLLLAFHAWLDEPGYPGNRALHIATLSFQQGSVTVIPT
jgi:Glycosyl hydrolases family 43